LVKIIGIRTEISFIITLDLIGFSIYQTGIGIFRTLERIYGFFIYTSSRNSSFEIGNNTRSYSSLVPYFPSGVGNGEVIIWIRIGTCGDNANIEGFCYGSGISHTGRITSSRGVSSYGEESDSSENGKDCDNNHKLYESKSYRLVDFFDFLWVHTEKVNTK
jgi:hypothetical protein